MANKFSKTGGLNPIWVEQDMRRREREESYSYEQTIPSNNSYIANATKAAVEGITKSITNQHDSGNIIINKGGNKKNKLKLEDELEIKLAFLKRHSDGTETEYQMAKHVLGV